MMFTAVGSGPAAHADDLYDRNLERSVMQIVSQKIGGIRGSLAREWAPKNASRFHILAQLDDAQQQWSEPTAPADIMATAAIRDRSAAQPITTATLEAVDDRTVRIIPIDHKGG